MDTNDQAQKQSSDRAGVSGLTEVDEAGKPYDASRDPRTGRPPNPLEAQRLAREHELERVGRAQTPEDVEKIYSDDEAPGPEDAQVPAEDGESDEEQQESALSREQAPARMTSPAGGEDDKAAADALVQEGITRERAEQLVEAHGADWETLKAAAWPEKMEDAGQSAEERERKARRAEHHDEGIPPFETPGAKE